jgi:hypothetical protein
MVKKGFLNSIPSEFMPIVLTCPHEDGLNTRLQKGKLPLRRGSP